MKKALIVLLIVVFSYNAYSQENQLNLPAINKLSDLNTKSSLSKTEYKDTIYKKSSRKLTFAFNPYLWGTAVGGTVGVPSLDKSFGFNKSTSDLLKNLKMAVMFDGKVKYERVSFLFDVVYANLKSFGATLPEGIPSLPKLPDYSTGTYKPVSANTTLKEFITDLALEYLFPGKPEAQIGMYGGVRIFAVDIEIALLDSAGAQYQYAASNTWVDPILGVSSEFLLSKKLRSWIKGDIGGFGVNSQFDVQMSSGLVYKLSDNFGIIGGFKWLFVNYNKNAFVFNVNEYGLLLGLNCRF